MASVRDRLSTASCARPPPVRSATLIWLLVRGVSSWVTQEAHCVLPNFGVPAIHPKRSQRTQKCMLALVKDAKGELGLVMVPHQLIQQVKVPKDVPEELDAVFNKVRERTRERQ